MDVDHAGKPIMIVGAREASGIVGTLTDLAIANDIGGITATGDLTGTVTGEIAVGTWVAIEPIVATAGRVPTRSLHRLSRPDQNIYKTSHSL